MIGKAAHLDVPRLEAALRSAKERLLSKRNAQGRWEGHLSSSALSTATAVFAIARCSSAEAAAELVHRGLNWLCANQNADGGWGDTVKSFSNLSTTALCCAALSVGLDDASRAAGAKARQWISLAVGNRDADPASAPARGGGLPFGAVRDGKTLDPDLLVHALAARYGKDRTFSVPILSMLALAGELGVGGWRRVMPLPFELARLPHRLFRFLRLQVVSYALPALIAVGQARFCQAPCTWPWEAVRRRAVEPTLRLLAEIQPESGGFLEAAPLTSFVLMNLSAGFGGEHAGRVIARGLGFLRNTVRDDGSWPIDTNLSTWVTTLSASALADGDRASPSSSSANSVSRGESASGLSVFCPEGAEGFSRGQSPRSAGAPTPSPEGAKGTASRSDDIRPVAPTGLLGFVASDPGAAPPAKSSRPFGPEECDGSAAECDGEGMGDGSYSWRETDRGTILDWLLAQQHRKEHPYTHAAPGGWAWTDLSGGVPDADDTAGALLAIRHLGNRDSRLFSCTPASAKIGDSPHFPAVLSGIEWLLDLQNADGGIPTFCRGWGKLPFDRSSPDLTAHAIRAWTAWVCELPEDLARRVWRACSLGEGFLAKSQCGDGSWNPLWFGNQRAPGDANPVYGTARVLRALNAAPNAAPCALADRLGKAAGYLLSAQNPDGGWGGSKGSPSSIEETAVAVEALCHANSAERQADAVRDAVVRGANFLMDATRDGTTFAPAPIGLYFAKLWYFEELYPLIFTISALRNTAKLQENAREANKDCRIAGQEPRES